MHVTIVGAGALGRVYGARLASLGTDVAFLVRPARAAETSPFAIEQVNGARARDVVAHPVRVTAVPRHTDVVLVAVRFDQIASAAAAPAGDALVECLRDAPKGPVVVLTPLLPKQRAGLDAALSRRLVPAMPSVSGYISHVDEREVVRYWTTKVASTLLEEPPASPGHEAMHEEARATLDNLARRLTKAGISSRLEPDVGSLNTGTTTGFFPLIAAIGAANGIDGVLADAEFLAVVLDAAKEADLLARKIGKVAPWAHMLTKFIGPFTLKPGVALARALFPEAVKFTEIHFGSKLHAQHVAMGEAILELGREQGLAMPALAQLVGVVRAKGGPA